MSRKAREKPTTTEPEPIGAGPVENILLAVAAITVVLVAIWFKLDVNRVFDVPKALALKVGGCGAFLVWLGYGLFGKGYRYRGFRLFAGPVFGLTLAVIVSTFLSFDTATSIYGVYERQFGLQGFLGCVGLFCVASTCFRSRRGAVVGLMILCAIGGVVGLYAALQSQGLDPYGFFKKPHNKVYSTLGNATFAGNALALIAPISTLLAITASTTVLNRKQEASELANATFGWVAGLVLVLGLPLSTALFMGDKPDTTGDPVVFKILIGIAMGVLFGAAGAGTWGVKELRLSDAKTRRLMDGVAAGGLVAMAAGIFAGLVFTRTRGAWVGTGVAITGALILLPNLFNDDRALKRKLQIGCYALLALLVLGGGTFVATSDHLYAKTIRSIPAAFDPSRTDYGKGQGTRRYLWAESPRVLLNHADTLQRVYKDHDDYAEKVTPVILDDVRGIYVKEKLTEGQKSFDTTWRSAAVWFFGIGVETYRYAFMSHKSKRLEALDPMTNHDNPHNNYLYVLASFGIFGLLAYLWLLSRLLREAWVRFSAKPRPLLTKKNGEYVPGVVAGFEIVEDDEKPRLFLTTQESLLVARTINEKEVGLRASPEAGRVIVTQFDAAQVLDQIAEMEVPLLSSRSERALAFGIVVSFFSYTVYSIAGFDSVACSVFFYFLLGTAAVLFDPSMEQSPRPLGAFLVHRWQTFRKKASGPVPNTAPMGLSVAIMVVFGGLLAHSVWGGIKVHRAEQAFVSVDRPRGRSAGEQIRNKLDNITRAIGINPNESFYKQSLGNTYADGIRVLQAEAGQLQQRGQPDAARDRLRMAETYAQRAEVALHAALDHAWAPENIFISAFQVYYRTRRTREAEAALERALEHSPHLGAVRANLAILKLERGAWEEAIKDCEWVLEVDPASGAAWRTCGRAYFMTDRMKEAEKALLKAKRYAPKDPVVQKYWEDLVTKKTSTSS